MIIKKLARLFAKDGKAFFFKKGRQRVLSDSEGFFILMTEPWYADSNLDSFQATRSPHGKFADDTDSMFGHLTILLISSRETEQSHAEHGICEKHGMGKERALVTEVLQ